MKNLKFLAFCSGMITDATLAEQFKIPKWTFKI